MIKVLIVENARSLREFLASLFSAQPGLQLVGTAKTGAEALELISSKHPDVITMGNQLPELDGLEVTRRIMEMSPVPIVMVADSGSPGEVASTFDAVNAGALAVLPRPPDVQDAAHTVAVRELVQTVKLMSEVKVVRRWPKAGRSESLQQPVKLELAQENSKPRVRIIAIGASTGGPLALATLLGGLPKNFPTPVVIVQHMAAGFTRGFIDWLAPASGLPIHIATNGERMHAGHVYMAPDGIQMKVSRNERIALANDNTENGLRPSVSCLFRSIAEVYGGDAAAVLLTGMGRDGANELRILKEKGAVTFAQDKESSIVHGMPGEAIKLNAALHVLPPGKIAARLAKLVNSDSEGEY